MSTYFKTKNKKDCYGCSVCSLVCPVNAITMKEDSEGFLYPEINKKICISCGLCERVCIKNNTKTNNISAYACKNKKITEKLNSTSGGIFPLLAKEILKNKGIVYAVKYDKDMLVVHSSATTEKQIVDFQKSKYVRSSFDGIFEDIKEKLLKKKQVLFIGTPCQVAGLNNYLNKDYNNLTTCDLICHSNPSPKVFKKYVEYFKENAMQVLSIDFRNKDDGWHKSKTSILLKDGNIYNNKKFMNNSFYKAFDYKLISRPSCHDCKFVDIKRVSDITLGDFWGVEKLYPKFNDNLGISLVLVNTEKGQKIFKKIKSQTKCLPIKIEYALKYNHNKPIKEHVFRKNFFLELDKMPIENLFKKYFRKIKVRVFFTKMIPEKIKIRLLDLLSKRKSD